MSIDVNTASREVLIALRGIGAELANTIISLRPFTSIEELLSIRGIGPRTLERLKRQGLVVGALPQETIRTTIPGFSAEASLYRASGYYGSVAHWYF